MRAEPLKKELFNRAKELGVDKIRLEFAGGNDEGYLYVTGEHGWDSKWNTQEEKEAHRKEIHQFESDVEEWCWEVYSYSGAGDGTEYGDTIVYNLKTNVVSTEEWYTQRSFGGECYDALETQ